MSQPIRAALLILALVCYSTLAPSPASAEHTRVNPPCVAVAFLVNGFTGCCIPEHVREFLKERGACVHVSNWNDIDQKGNPGVPVADFKNFGWRVTPAPDNDQDFVRAMAKTIKNDVDPTTPLILIGHSFGGDAVLQVAKSIGDRKIAFLGILDGVGRGGLRKNITRPVPANVEYFFNRWQQNVGSIASNPGSSMPEIHWIPLDRLLSGKISSGAAEADQKRQSVEKTKNCKAKTRKIKAIKNLLTHGNVPNDSCIQAKIEKILLAQVFTGAPASITTAPRGTRSSAPTDQ